MKLSGMHLIAGEWLGSDDSFLWDPAHGQARSFSSGTVDLVDQAVRSAEDAFGSFGYTSQRERADLLNAIADEIEARADAITQIGCEESGLPQARLVGERGRTVAQLRMFATHILDDSYLGRRHDDALPDRTPLARPDIQLVKRPIGPVAVFGASNFPLAFSTAGGDTASALAAGCPVVVRGHFAHPGTAEITAMAIEAAVAKCGLHPGVFSLIQGGGLHVGQALVEHPLIRAVGFTGSHRGGRALFDLCVQRPEPIPFFGELGSVNPMFLLPAAMSARSDELAAGWAGSLTLGAGQFCTNPGVAVVIDGRDADRFQAAATGALASVGAQTMLTDGIAEAYHKGQDRVAGTAGVETLVGAGPQEPRSATASLHVTTGGEWLANPLLREEVFGPLGIVVRVPDAMAMMDIARKLQGELTCTIHWDSDDLQMAGSLLPILERKAGRILANGFPTGVEVCDAMVHGGPYPASTNFGATSVGTMAIERWLRPVCYQNMPELIAGR